MDKGELLGIGKTAEVYKWGQDKVLKLYFNNYDDSWVRREAQITQKVHEAGVSSPAVYDIIKFEGRRGIVIERIFGKTMTSAFETEPWSIFDYVQQMIRFHYEIHKYSTAGIPTQKEKFENAIKLSSKILGNRMERVLDYIDMLPDGKSICHGDLYLSNLIVSNNKLVAIDWSGGYRGNPLGDVARTCLIINSPAVPPGTPYILAAMSTYPKWLSCWYYLNEYMRIANVKFEDIDAWMLPVAAARLKDNIPGEEKWLMKIINERLERLEK
ncbi:phosphotransferase [Acetivibrio cellulolyticus]|uniref:phosphotransferase n=1 Tax=Acetivibrio cellulolyticus TaxID=35830 RepID=UPI0001E2DE17|nr:phosphotransferase [Acetivibrio cellulolyticus]